MLKDYLSAEELDLNKIRSALKKQFDEDQNFTIDLSGVRAVSPSFAYQCFGRLYDKKSELEKLLDRIDIVNDNFNFKDKIIKAIRRRIMVLSEET